MASVDQPRVHLTGYCEIHAGMADENPGHRTCLDYRHNTLSLRYRGLRQGQWGWAKKTSMVPAEGERSMGGHLAAWSQVRVCTSQVGIPATEAIRASQVLTASRPPTGEAERIKVRDRRWSGRWQPGRSRHI